MKTKTKLILIAICAVLFAMIAIWSLNTDKLIEVDISKTTEINNPTEPTTEINNDTNSTVETIGTNEDIDNYNFEEHLTNYHEINLVTTDENSTPQEDSSNRVNDDLSHITIIETSQTKFNDETVHIVTYSLTNTPQDKSYVTSILKYSDSDSPEVINVENGNNVINLKEQPFIENSEMPIIDLKISESSKTTLVSFTIKNETEYEVDFGKRASQYAVVIENTNGEKFSKNFNSPHTLKVGESKKMTYFIDNSIESIGEIKFIYITNLNAKRYDSLKNPVEDEFDFLMYYKGVDSEVYSNKFIELFYRK